MSHSQNNEVPELVFFSLDEPRYALHLNAVIRVIQSVEITPLPKAPDIIKGVINLSGEPVPVVDIRKLFQLPPKQIGLDQQFIVAQTKKRKIAIVVDQVTGVARLVNHKLAGAAEIQPFAAYLSGITIYDNKIILIHDLDTFLSLDEERLLDESLNYG